MVTTRYSTLMKVRQMRIVSAVFCLFMILFAGVQYNDPDAIYWVVIYGVAAFWCGMAAFRPNVISGRLWRAALIVTLGLMVVGVVWHWPRTPGFWKQDVWWVTETAREGMGIMVALIAVGIAWLALRKGRANT